jgi:hypothetical protein
VHAVAEVHDTPLRSPPVGLGVASIAHVFPFQASASVPPGPAPTAVHAVADVHDTPLRSPPVGLGVASIAHDFPFQASANVPLGPAPTAVHAVADVHDTPLRSPPVGLGVASIAHDLPFQASANVPLGPAPTAVHAIGEVQDTLDSCPGRAAEFGLRAIDRSCAALAVTGMPMAATNTPTTAAARSGWCFIADPQCCRSARAIRVSCPPAFVVAHF